MAATDTLELVLRQKKAGDAAKRTEKELKDLSKASGEASKAFEKFNMGMLAVEGAVLGAGIAFLRSIPSLVEHGIEIQRAETALAAYTGSAEAAEYATERMVEATDGALSNFTAMQQATRLMAMGLADNAEEAANLADIAVTLGSTMGKGPTQAIEEFTLLLANQSILRLDTFGISGAKTRERMAELAEEMPNASRETLFLTSVMEEAEKKMTALSEAGYSATTSLERFKARTDNAKDSISTFFAEGLLPYLEILDYFAEKLDNVGISLDGLTIKSEWFAQAIQDLEKVFPPLHLAMMAGWVDATTEAEAYATMIDEVGQRSKGMVRGSAEDFAALEEQITNVRLSLGELSEAELAREGLQALNKAYEEGEISAEQYKSEFLLLTDSLTDMSDEQQKAHLALFGLQNDFAAGKSSAHQFLEELIKLNKEIANFQWQGGAGKGKGRYQHGGSFIVDGEDGIDRNFVPLWLTKGERVDITPAYQTTNNNYSQPFSGATINITNDVSAKAFERMLRDYAGV